MRRRHPRLDASPADAARFAPVVKTIREHGRPAGFALARDLVLENYEQLDEIPAAVRLKLAIEFDRHSMFAETFGMKQSGKDGDWTELQAYLNFTTEAIPQTTATITRGGRLTVEPGAPVDTDDGLGPDDDGEPDDE